MRDLISLICKTKDVEIIKASVSISKLMQSLKGKTSYKLIAKYKELSKLFRGRHMWGRGYFVSSFGNVTDEVIMEYIAPSIFKKMMVTFILPHNEETALADSSIQPVGSFEPTRLSR